MQYIQDTTSSDDIFNAFLLIGLLANYNKFEFRNPYRLRLEDFVNETTIGYMTNAFRKTTSLLRDQYVAIQEDKTEGWSISSTLTYIGLGVLVPAQPPAPVKASDAKGDFGALYVSKLRHLTFDLYADHHIDLTRRPLSSLVLMNLQLQTKCSVTIS